MQSSPSFIKKYVKKLPLSLVVLLALFAGVLFLFVFIVHEVLLEKEEAVDNYILRVFSLHVINSRLTGFMKGITYFASATFLQIVYAILVLRYLFIKNYKRAVEISVIGIGGFL